MKKLLSLLVALTFVMGLAAVIYADEMVKGTVVSIDSAGKAIVIDTSEGRKTVVLQKSTMGVKGIKPGMSVEMTCVDLEGKSCAKIIKPMYPVKSIEGEVVSIDPAGKTVVIKTIKGEEVTVETMTGEAEMMKPSGMAGGTEEMMAVEKMPVSEMKPGIQVKMDCFDSGEKFCADRITAVSVEEAGKPVPGAKEITGEVVSIDSAGKSVVVKTVTGEKTLYYQKVTTGAPMDELKIRENVKAYCLDIEGKSCIKDINVAE